MSQLRRRSSSSRDMGLIAPLLPVLLLALVAGLELGGGSHVLRSDDSPPDLSFPILVEPISWRFKGCCHQVSVEGDEKVESCGTSGCVYPASQRSRSSEEQPLQLVSGLVGEEWQGSGQLISYYREEALRHEFPNSTC